MARRYGLLDRLIGEADHALRTVLTAATSNSASPADAMAEMELSDQDKQHSAGLMRVDHTGEVCAQALYRGQAMVARQTETREHLLQAADEEHAHLAWCAERLQQLDSRPSVLNPFWYGASFGIGVAAGLAGDRWSYGFVVETERQVEQHLTEHLTTLPKQDAMSRAILSQMLADEAQHAAEAEKRGGKPLPKPVKLIMKFQSKVMTKTAYCL